MCQQQHHLEELTDGQQQYHLEELTEGVRFNNIQNSKDVSEESCFNCNNINSEQKEEENLDEN